MRFGRAVKIVAVVAAVALLGVGALFLLRTADAPSDGVTSVALDDVAAAVDLGDSSGVIWAAGVSGSGNTCSSAKPCATDIALAKAGPGDVITLAPGRYPLLRVSATGKRTTGAAPVVIRSAGVPAELAGLSLKAPGIRVENVTVTGTVYVNPSAVDATLRNVHVDGAGVFLRANGSRLLNSLVENGSSIDGVQIKNGAGILMQGNTIRNFDPLSGALHADCIQLFDVQDVVIRGNTIHDCDNASIIFSGGGGQGIKNVLVESNFVTGCRVKSDRCRGGTAIDLREKSARDVVVRNNTFAGGSVRIEPTPGQVNDRNVFGYISSCTTPMTNSIVRSWNQGLCSTPSILGKNGNIQGTAAVVYNAGVDYHVAEAQRATVTVKAVGVTYPAGIGTARDFDGQAFAPGTVGADEPGNGPVVSPGAGSSAVPTSASSSSAAPSGSAQPAPTTAGATTSRAQSSLQVVLTVQSPTGAGRAVLTARVSGGTARGLQFSVPGRLTSAGTTSDGGVTWTVTVDTTRVPVGTYQVVAIATGAAGATVTSAPVPVTVQR
jgi:hypothetical protein